MLTADAGQIVSRPHAAFGSEVIDPANWTPERLASDSTWRHELSSRQAAGLVDLARRVEKQIEGHPNGLLALGQEDLALEPIEDVIAAVRHGLKDGLGLCLIKGVPTGDIPLLQSAIIYWAIGRHLGSAMSNNPEGDMLGHVTDTGKELTHPNHRGYQTREGLDFHCDTSGVVGLMCITTPRSGGLSKVASSVAVYNKILQTAPHHLKTLSEPYCWTLHGEVNPGEQGWYESPIFNFLDGQLCVAFGPSHIIKGHKLDGAPPMTDEQLAAMRYMEDVCDSLHYSMQLEVGDIQLLNNGVCLHTRTAYDDWPEPERKRHLWRLWLDTPHIRPRTAYQQQFLGGIKLRGTQERLTLKY
ncbi:MAG: TauD/TfdA family dioxygenase [Pigmentiphaga sp.]|nr:TauD/TfdA family dioxygenase [Pigmentiphaga sp.]